MTAPLLVDAILQGERQLERRLAGCALVHPRDAVALAVRPEIDLAAIAFFRRLDRHAADLLASDPDDLRSINFAWRCAGRDAWLFWDAVRDLNSFSELPTLPDEVRALRAARKAATWIQDSGLLQEVCSYAA